MINKLIELLPIIPCQEATRLISASMERKLSLKENVSLKLHIYVCKLCQRFEYQIQSLRQLLRKYHPFNEQTLSMDIKNQMKKNLLKP